MKLSEYRMPEPGFEKLFRAEVILGEPMPLGDIGTGYSEIVPVKGGRFEGRINGQIMDFGGDWGLLYDDNINAMDTRYLLKTDDGAFISIKCRGRLIMDMETMSGERDEYPDGEEYYFRTTVELTTGAEKYRWVNRLVVFAVTIITEEGNVCLDVYAIK
ncbi:MAG: DUF3237 domain-containing protein [Anaerovoracaceae bacterium]|nr:DUF3237 domain-containing protein [Anaerovoracaceae bacterium]